MIAEPSFDYQQLGPPQVRQLRMRQQDGVINQLLTYTTPSGDRRIAEIIRPAREGPLAPILYVHWYEPESLDSNRTQFQREATLMADRGAVALLIETMWSDRDWFLKRTQSDDQQNSTRQVIELRQALDLLLAQPGADPRRCAYVGHDFGAMYGVLMGSVDSRPCCYVLMAGTPRFSDWYLYSPRLEGEARETYIKTMAPIDPIAHAAQLTPAPLLFQFGRDDPHVPEDRALAFYTAAQEPKQIRWYEAGHGLNQEAEQERVEWLAAQLRLDKPATL